MAQNFEWAKQLGGTNSDQVFQTLIDEENNSYTLANFIGTVDFDPGQGIVNLSSAGANDIVFYKLDSAGQFVWANKIGGSSNELAVDMAIDRGKNLYITGAFRGTVDFDPGNGVSSKTAMGLNSDIFIAKYDSAGNFKWVNTYGTSNIDDGRYIEVDSASNVYVAGTFRGTVDFDPGVGVFNLVANTSSNSSKTFITKLDSLGNLIWANTFIDVNVLLFNSGYPFNFKVNDNGNIFITGYFGGTLDFDASGNTFNLTTVSNNFDGYAAKLNTGGNLMWVRQIGGFARQSAFGIAIDDSSNVYISGHFNDSIDFQQGASMVSKYLPGNDNIFVCKYTTNGQLKWTDVIGGFGFEFLKSINLDRYSNVYVCGKSYDSLSNVARPAVHKYDLNGTRLWSISLPGSGEVVDLKVDDSLNIYLAGNFSGLMDFDPGVDTVYGSSNGANDLFNLKLNQRILTSLFQSARAEASFQLAPNPSSGEVRLHIMAGNKTANKSSDLRIYSLSGEQVFQAEISLQQAQTLNLSELKSGIYVVVYQGLSQKLILQK